ncbi:HAMP domain-containing histidine kinase [Phaeobacter inhibens]|uniref:sensor histidine kinase n=1 Tax=Phaeobacter inhibens TaxID=221822 RepID=UPI0021A6E11E|nr:HAMP domain-containing sensor histidine kinase [Phaeobacter inhibens]UWR42080.1 HAMP domain-containing histidine kinase [Phaeobacter inhibens]
MKVIDELILMTRFDSGAALETYETVDLTAIAAEECARTEGCTLSGDPIETPGNARMLRPPRSQPTGQCEQTWRTTINIEPQKSSESVLLTVSDAGPSIKPEDQRKVFEPFYRGAGKQNTEGSGLSLPLVARIVEAHGATLEVRNTPRSEVAVSNAHTG